MLPLGIYAPLRSHRLNGGLTHYTSNSGINELRELVVSYLSERFDVHYPAPSVLMTVGASEGLDLAFRALLDPGDEVLIPAPSYVSYEPGCASGLWDPCAYPDDRGS